MSRTLLLILISILPLNRLRILGYRLIFGYRISSDSSIGPLNLIDCRAVTMSGAAIGSCNVICADSFQAERGAEVRRFNRFRHLNRVVLREGAIIVGRNSFVGAVDGLSPYDRLRNLHIGRNSVITRSHAIDVTDTVRIGDDVTLAGSGIQIWSHGFDLNHVRVQAPVTIGNTVYIGSRSTILAGVDICDHVSIGAATVVSRAITEPGFYVSNQLLRKADAVAYTEHPDTTEYHGHRFMRRGGHEIASGRTLHLNRPAEPATVEERAGV
jgi:acetyltransferase-like isoleucine patch superfamily enzyme